MMRNLIVFACCITVGLSFYVPQRRFAVNHGGRFGMASKRNAEMLERRIAGGFGGGIMSKRIFGGYGSGIMSKRILGGYGSGIISKRIFGGYGSGIISKRMFGGYGSGVMSKRGAEQADLTSLAAAIHGLLDKAANGIGVGELVSEAQQIAQMADVTGEAAGAEVDASAVEDMIDDVAKQSDGAAAVSALFDGPLDFDASKMDSALHLLGGLTVRAQELQQAGEPLQNVMAAIEMTIAAMEDTCKDVVDTVIFLDILDQGEDSADSEDVKRGDWEVGVGYNQNQGFNVGLTYRFKG